VPDIFAVQSTPAGKRIFSLKPDGVSIAFETKGTGVYVEDHYTFDEYAKLRAMRPDIIPAIPKSGNTIGKIVGQTSTNPVPANQANPPPKPETEKEKGFWAKYGGGILDDTQLVLDGVGLIPGVGEIADGANALISLGRGDYAGATLSAAAMIPFAGWGATAAKAAKKAAEAADAVNDAKKAADAVNDAQKAKAVAEGTAKAGEEIVDQSVKHADEAAEAGKKFDGDGAKVKEESVETGDIEKIPPLRQAYVDEVKALEDISRKMKAEGATSEQIARQLHEMRRDLGVKYKNLTPPEKLKEIYARNLERYGDKLGTSIDWLRAKGKTWEQIIESASRSGGKDLGL